MIKDNIRIARKAAGFTQETLGKAIGVKKQTVQKYEDGTITNVPYDKLLAIADVCNVHPGVLLGWNVPEENKPDVEKVAGIIDSLSDDQQIELALDILKRKLGK